MTTFLFFTLLTLALAPLIAVWALCYAAKSGDEQMNNVFKEKP